MGDISTVSSADTMTIDLKNVAKPSIASSPAEIVVSTPVKPTTAAPVTASVRSVMPSAAHSRRGKQEVDHQDEQRAARQQELGQQVVEVGGSEPGRHACS